MSGGPSCPISPTSPPSCRKSSRCTWNPAAHAQALRDAECFRTAWVCDECGDAADAGVFLWTAHRADGVRICLLIHNDGGIWQVSLHPFEFPGREAQETLNDP